MAYSLSIVSRWWVTAQHVRRSYLNRDTLLKVDNLSLTGLALLAVLFGYLAFKPAELKESSNDSTLIAKLTKTQSSVKRKPANGLAWGLADDESKLFDGDQIFTENKSAATVIFDDGSEIIVAENSLIKIEKLAGKTTIDMSKGFVSGKLEGGSGLTLKMGNTKVALTKGSEIQIKVDPNNKNNTRVSLIKGDATIESGKKILELKKDQILNVGDRGTNITQISLKPILPAPGRRIDADETPTIFFTWESLLQLEYRLMIARDPGYREIITNLSTNSPSATIKAPLPGQYYWKVIGKDPKTGKIEESINIPFSVIKMLPPELLAPVAGREFIFAKSDREQEAISFLWRAFESDSRSEFQLAKTPDFREPIQSHSLEDTQLVLSDLEPGAYFWRVRTLRQSSSRSSSYSPTYDFRIERASPPAAPTLIAPDSSVRLSPGQLISLNWSEVLLSNGYRIEIYSQDRLVLSELERNTSYSWTPQSPGRYQWRVRAEDSFGRETPYSETRTIIVDFKPPTLVLPSDRDNFMLTQKTLPIELTWTAVNRTSPYELEIARDSEFESLALRVKMQATNYTWTIDAAGVYFWRVRSLIAGMEDAPYSAIRQFTIKDFELLPAPILLDRYYFRIAPPLFDSPKLKPLPSSINSASINSGFNSDTMRWQIRPSFHGLGAYLKFVDALIKTSIAVGQTVLSTNGPVDIKWEAVPNAIHYELEVAQDARFNRILFKKKLNNPRFIWPDAKPGRYFFRASSIDSRERPGPFSRVSELIVSYQATNLISPADNMIFVPKPGSREVEFTWQASAVARRYTIEISGNADFSQPLFTRQVDGRTARLTTELEPGSYLWRIMTRYAGENNLVISDPYRFTVKYTDLPATELLQPPSDSTLKHESDRLSVIFAWKPINGAQTYNLELSRSSDFFDLERNVKIDNDTSHEEELADGTYYWRVRGQFSKRPSPNYSPIWKFDIKMKPSIPEWILPENGDTIFYEEPIPPKITLAWKQAGNAETYDLEISPTSDFKHKTVKTQTQASNYTLRLEDGQYFARVRGRRHNGEISSWSRPHEFTQAREIPDAPELVYPSDGQSVVRKKSIRLSWKQNDGFHGYRFVVARDQEFKSIIKDINIDQTHQTEQTLINLSKGKYFWYVEGEYRPRKLAIKSDIQMFTITPPVDPGQADTLRLQAGYAPSIISNSMASQTIANSLAIVATNSFALDGSYWFSQPLGVALAYHRKSATLYSQRLEDSSDQSPLEYIPQHTSVLCRYRIFLGKPGQAFELHARAGYIYKTFYTYYAESRTAIGLVETGAHNLQLGLGGKIPLNKKDSIEAFLDYGRAVASKPSKITGGANVLFDAGYHRHLVGRFSLGLGYRYGKASYDFIEPTHEIIGTLQETTHSLMGGIEYGF